MLPYPQYRALMHALRGSRRAPAWCVVCTLCLQWVSQVRGGDQMWWKRRHRFHGSAAYPWLHPQSSVGGAGMGWGQASLTFQFHAFASKQKIRFELLPLLHKRQTRWAKMVYRGGHHIHLGPNVTINATFSEAVRCPPRKIY